MDNAQYRNIKKYSQQSDLGYIRKLKNDWVGGIVNRVGSAPKLILNQNLLPYL